MSVPRRGSNAAAAPLALLGAACRLCAAPYAASLTRGTSGWKVAKAHGLSPADRAALRRALQSPSLRAALDGQAVSAPARAADLPGMPGRLGAAMGLSAT